MSRKLFLSIFCFIVVLVHSFGQQNQETKPNRIEHSSSMRVVKPMAQKSQLIPAKKFDGEIKDARSSRNKVIIGKGSTGDDKLLSNSSNNRANSIPGNTPSLVFDTTEQNSQPTDPSLAVGPAHVVAVFNTGWRIFDKNGNALTNEISPDNLFTPGSCCDLTISYDNAADRWVMSILYSSDGHVEVAVSQGPDPINDAWSVYSFANVSDYQKLSVWSDGYYMTANVNSGSAGTSDVIFVFDRAAMLAGNATATLVTFPLPGISTSGFYSPQAFNVSNGDLPAAGNAPIVYMQDDAWGGVTDDHVKLWTANVNFSDPASSTISQPTELVTTDFNAVFDAGAFANLTQPNGGQDIDALQATIMNQAQFRKFPTHNSALFNFVVDTDGSSEELAGIRWFELRQTGDGQPWTIYQEGTYTSPDGKHAWHGSLIMDGDGNIGMGYTGMGGTTNTVVSSYYTGRFANDPLGTMTFDETLIAAGGGNIPGSERYGDYGKIDIDPSTDSTFWFVNEYVNAAGNRANVAGVFTLVSGLTNDVAPVNIDLAEEGTFSSTETITTTIYNLGSSDASSFDVSYQINGGTAVTETFTGTIMPYQSVDFSFTQTADLSVEGQIYDITVSTNLSSDQLTSNNSFTQTVNHIFANEIGLAEIISPNSGQNLGDENVTIRVTNFGGAAQADFDVSYSVDGAAAITETVAGPLQPGASLEYTFAQTVNLAAEARYVIEASTLLTNDGNVANNTATKEIDSFSCNDFTNNTAVAIDPATPNTVSSAIESTVDQLVEKVIVTVNIEHTWVSDLTLRLVAPDNTVIVLSNRRGGNADNYTNTVFDDDASQAIAEGAAPFTGSFRPEDALSNLVGKSTLGTWELFAQDGFNGDGGQIVDWTLSFCTLPSLSVGENLDPNNELKIIYKDNNQFDIRFDSDSVSEQLEMDVFNISGQRLLHYRLNKENGIGYYYDLDMSYASSGVYLVRLKDKQNRFKIKRLVVK